MIPGMRLGETQVRKTRALSADLTGALFLIAVGAVLRWAVNVESEAFDIQLAGLIVFIVGIVGLLISLFFFISRRSQPVHPDHYVDE